MSKRAILRFSGEFTQGFAVTLEVQEDQQTFTEASGSLPANPELLAALEHWQTTYRRWLLGSHGSRIGPVQVVVEPSSQTTFNACRRWGRTLQQQMEQWLASPSFSPIDRRLREALSPADEAQLLLRSEETQLHRLPWQVWGFLERYLRMEVVFASSMERLQFQHSGHEKVRILAILGSHDGELATNVDRDRLEALPNAEIHWVRPSRSEIDDRLWEQSWDILFFAGHSYSEGKTGYLSLSSSESLTVDEVRYGLRRAIERGLQLAIFNSCDGLGLAYDLESLHLPQLVVMREPVPDEVAQQFLTHFLLAFSKGEALHRAVRQARERLQRLEAKFAFATWLPVLFQNPAVVPTTWKQLQGNLPELSDSENDSEKSKDQPLPDLTQGETRGRWRSRWLSSLGVSALVMALRYAGLLQGAELGLYDFGLRSRPAELPDDRFVVVEISDDYVRAQPESELQGRSIGDADLAKLLTTLDALNPSTIALDLYRDEGTALPQLQQQFAENSRLLTICKGADSAGNVQGIDPPPNVPPERVGFSDVRSDGDEVVRTQFLSAATYETSCLDYSLSAAIADHYLFNAGVELSVQANTWQWSDTRVTRIGKSWVRWPSRFFHYGPYAGLNASGFQVLLNYRTSDREQYKSPMASFLRWPIEEVLAGNINAREIEGKIVLIGTTTIQETQEPDRWLTPYRTFEDKPLIIPGVHLQAQMASQLVSAVLDGRQLLWALPFWLDGVMVVLVAMGGAVLLCQVQPVGLKALGAGLLGLLLGAIAWGSFVWMGLYLPLIPMLLATGGNWGVMQVGDRRSRTRLIKSQ